MVALGHIGGGKHLNHVLWENPTVVKSKTVSFTGSDNPSSPSDI